MEIEIAKDINVVIIEDYALVRCVVRSMCENFGNIKVCAEFDNAEDALGYIFNNRVDMVFIDMWLPKMNGIEASNVLKRLNPELKIVMTVPYLYKNDVLGSIYANVDAFTLNDLDTKHFEKIINVIFNGGSWVDFRFLYQIFKLMGNLPKPDYYYIKELLTPVETNFITRVLQGFSMSEITNALNLQGSDISLYINSIFKKLAKTDMAEKMLRSIRYDLV